MRLDRDQSCHRSRRRAGGGPPGELRLGPPAGGSRPYDESYRGDAGGGGHGIPAEAPDGIPLLRSRGEHRGLLAQASDHASRDLRADLAPERVADQVIGIPCLAQSGVRPEPPEMHLKTFALKLAVNER